MAKLFEGGGKAISLEDLDTPQEPQSAEPAEPQVQEPVSETAPETELQVTEPVVQEPVAEPTEAPAEEPAPQEEPVQPEEPAKEFDFALFNSSLNKNYESLDQIKADLEKPTMETEYQEATTQLEELQTKLKDLDETNALLTEKLDPSTYFSSEDAMKLEVFKKENPRKDASVAQKVFSTEDLSSIDDLEMVKMGWKFSNPKLSNKSDIDLEAAIMEELKIEPDTPRNEWPGPAQVRLERMAGEFIGAFDQLKSSITLPEKVNIDELKSQRKQAEEQRQLTLTEGWTKIADESLKATSKVSLPIGEAKEGEGQKFFEWELGEPPKEEVEKLKKAYIDFGLDPADKEVSAAFKESLDFALWNKNKSQIMLKYGEDLLARQKEEFLEKTNNPEPLKDSQRTDLSESERAKKEQTAAILDGLGPSFMGKPLFKK